MLAAFVLLSFTFVRHSKSASPANGSISSAGPTLNWVGAPAVASNPDDELLCVDGVNCDTYTVTLSGTPVDWTGKKALITISWTGAEDDFDVIVHKGSNSGPVVGSTAASGAGPETVELDPNNASIGTGVFTVHVIYWLVLPTDTYNGKIEVIGGNSTPTPTPSATPTPTPGAAGAPRFFNYYPADGVATDAGEPSIGINWNTENLARAPGQTFKNTTRATNAQNTIYNGGTSNYYGGFLPFMLRATFDDCSSPAGVQFDQMPVTLPAAPRVFGDPILFTDHITGRTFVNQEIALTPLGSTMEFTDDDGENFFPSQGGGPSGVDHQTVGGGPYHAPIPAIPPGTVYPHAVYYASQYIATATSQLSVDGGITFPIQTPMFTAVDCTGLHGHLKVAEDGTAFVPNRVCSPAGVPFVFGGNPGVTVSENNGATWTIRLVPGVDANAGLDDAAVGVSICPPAQASGTGTPIPCDKAARSNFIYLGFMNNEGQPGVAVSSNKGASWDRIVNLSQISNIKHIAFPEMVAGDPDRATFSFFGTETEGNYADAAFPGVWYLYTASTFDSGVTWTIQNITPNDPIQRGGICADGTCRNLLDFYDIQVDKQGRVMIAGQDGCIGGCVNGGPNSFTAKAFIGRQEGGKRLFSIFDPVEPAPPKAPRLTGFANAGNTSVTLSWTPPDHSGSPITSYKVFRSPVQGGPGGSYAGLTPIATVTEPNFTDTTFPPGPKYYVVTAVNAQGEGPFCNEIAPGVDTGPTRCDLPGLLASNDVAADGSDTDSGQNTPVDPGVNARQLFVAEPYISVGVEKLYFTLQVAPSLTTPTAPNSQWFIIWNRQGTNPADPNDAEYDRMYVAMRTDGNGVPSFEYGKFGIPINTSPPPLPSANANTPVKVGNADSGTYNKVTGLIRIEISHSKFRAIDGGASKYVAGTDLAGINVRTYFNRLDPGQRSQNNASDITGDGSYLLGGNAACAPAVVAPINVVSRKTHGAAGVKDVKLFPLVPSTAVAIEPRTGNDNVAGKHSVVFVFPQPVTLTGATATSDRGGSATVESVTNVGSEVTVNLTGVTDAQYLTINLANVSAGGPGATVSVKVGMLVGDTTGETNVNSSDIGQTKSQSGNATDNGNYRNDVTVNGTINSSDIGTVKSKSGNGIGAPPAASEQNGQRAAARR